MLQDIERITGHRIEWLGAGQMATAYRSFTDTNTVFLLTDYDDPVRPLLASIDRKVFEHIPMLEHIADLPAGVLWQTEYNPLADEGTIAYQQNAILEHQWSIFDRRYFYGRNKLTQYKDYYRIARLFIDYLDDAQLIDYSIIAALNMIYNRAIEHKGTFKFEFQCYNLGIDTKTGILILRDPLYFADMPQYQNITMGNGRFIDEELAV